MPYRRRQFNNGDICHIVVRGIDNNLIFKDIDDYYRGIFSIYEFNNANSVEIYKRRRDIKTIKKKFKEQIGGDRVSPKIPDLRDRFVNVLVFCLMPNHIHLLLQQVKDNGITKFMTKLGVGYGGYFNRKYTRKGYVFQNRFVSVHIKTDDQLQVVFAYIHVNPISLIEPKWKENGIRNIKKVTKFFENYKWSSCSDYIGDKNFPSVTERDLIINTIGSGKSCKNFLEDWIKYKSNIRKFPKFMLE